MLTSGVQVMDGSRQQLLYGWIKTLFRSCWAGEICSVTDRAWLNAIKPRSIVNAFRGSGIYPVDASKAGIKIAPSKVFSNPSKKATTSNHSAALEALEARLSEEVKVKVTEHLAEGYDLNDPLHGAWRGLKTAVAGSKNSGSSSLSMDAFLDPIPDFSSLSISTAFKEVLTRN